MREIYLDWNATTPPHPDVLAAMRDAAVHAWGNPSSVHAAGRRARGLVEDARERLAGMLAVHPRDVVFTSGATEANNLALRDAPALVLSRLEHPSVLRQAEANARSGRVVRWVHVAASGRLEVEAVARAIDGLEPGFVVALMAANHETGVLQPVREVADLVHAVGGAVHCDVVQTFGKWPLDDALAADSFSVSAHKIRGPKGLGALAWRTRGPRGPLLLGGTQERGLRAGTLDPIAAAGLSVALRRIAAEGVAAYSGLAVLRDQIEAALLPFGVVNGAESPRLPHVAHVSVEGWRADELVAALDLEGVRVSSGAACSAGTTEPSEGLVAMVGSARAASGIRITLGDATTSSEVREAIAVLNQVLTSRTSSA